MQLLHNTYLHKLIIQWYGRHVMTADYGMTGIRAHIYEGFANVAVTQIKCSYS